MNIKKMSGSLVAATLLLGLNTVVMADELCDKAVSAAITPTEDLANELRCKLTDVYELDRMWPSEYPIWKWKGKVHKGCAIHEKLAKQLNELRDEYDPDTMPPYKGAKTKSGNNAAAGAANELRNGNIESALGHYLTFIYVIDNSVKRNDDPEKWNADETGFASAEAAEWDFRTRVSDLHGAVSSACPLL